VLNKNVNGTRRGNRDPGGRKGEEFGPILPELLQKCVTQKIAGRTKGGGGSRGQGNETLSITEVGSDRGEGLQYSSWEP